MGQRLESGMEALVKKKESNAPMWPSVTSSPSMFFLVLILPEKKLDTGGSPIDFPASAFCKRLGIELSGWVGYYDRRRGGQELFARGKEEGRKMGFYMYLQRDPLLLVARWMANGRKEERWDGTTFSTRSPS